MSHKKIIIEDADEYVLRPDDPAICDQSSSGTGFFFLILICILGVLFYFFR